MLSYEDSYIQIQSQLQMFKIQTKHFQNLVNGPSLFSVAPCNTPLSLKDEDFYLKCFHFIFPQAVQLIEHQCFYQIFQFHQYVQTQIPRNRKYVAEFNSDTITSRYLESEGMHKTSEDLLLYGAEKKISGLGSIYEVK